MKRTKAAVGALAGVVAAAAALVIVPAAAAHAHVSPELTKSKSSTLFALTVPTEKEGQTTTTVELTPPSDFSIGSFGPSPGWKRQVQTTGSGENTRIVKVTWSGGHVPLDESAFFEFTGEAESATALKFDVRQTYSNGEVVDWAGPESSDTPAPVVGAKSSLGGGGTSILAIVGLIVAAVALVLAGLALVSRAGTRQLA